MSLRSKVWVTAGLLCASMAAQAEYKEVWNPPEAARGAHHAHQATAAAPYPKVAAKSVVPAKAQPKPNKPHGVAVKKAHATSASPAHAKPVEAAAKPRQSAASPAARSSSGSTPRELPPILH